MAEDAWRAVGAPRWVLRILRFGLRLPWVARRRPGRRSRPYPLPDKDKGFVASELERWQEAGFIRPLSAAGISRARCISPAFVSYAAAKPRLVIDLREVNSYLEAKPFKYELLPEFVAMLLLQDHLVSWDI